MYSEYKESPTFKNPYKSQDELKRMPNSKFESTNSYEKANNAKTLRWNIEESKENLVSTKDRLFTSSYNQFNRAELSGVKRS